MKLDIPIICPICDNPLDAIPYKKVAKTNLAEYDKHPMHYPLHLVHYQSSYSFNLDVAITHQMTHATTLQQSFWN